MTEFVEQLRPSEVKAEWETLIEAAVQPLTEEHQLDYVAWYHDTPVWFVGDVQLGLIRAWGVNLVEVHKGSDNHLVFQVEKLGAEALRSVVECLITATPARPA